MLYLPSKQKIFGLLQQVPPTDKPFECLALNTVDRFNYYQKKKKKVIDHATCFVWGYPSKSVTTKTYIMCKKYLELLNKTQNINLFIKIYFVAFKVCPIKFNTTGKCSIGR